MFLSWKTTAAGIAAILTAIGSGLASLANGEGISADTIAALAAGIGLLMARDNRVTDRDLR